MINRIFTIAVFTICAVLSAKGQTSTDSAVLTIGRTIDEIEVVQQRSPQIVSQKSNQQIVDMKQLESIPKFLGTSDPMRYLQTLAGVQTNSETQAGIHIQGCDAYQTLVSINEAPVFYPNHLLGLFSTFVPAHFETMTIEQGEHRGNMTNRIGGWVDLQTQHKQPERFGLSGNVGLINSDLTLTIPCGEKSALWVSGRTSYINMLYGKLLTIEGMGMAYNFQDYNLTYAYHPTEQDELVISGFYSRDQLGVDGNILFDLGVCWQNVTSSATWRHQFARGRLQSSLSFSGFDNLIDVHAQERTTHIGTLAQFASAEWKNKYSHALTDNLSLMVGADYKHYLEYPLTFDMTGLSLPVVPQGGLRQADETSIYADLHHYVTHWFDYNVGVHGSVYHHNQQFYWGIDPRVTATFRPAEGHMLAAHYGMYHQYFHKAGLTDGGLPTDFFFLSDETFLPEWSHATNLKYTFSYKEKYAASIEGYFKQIYDVYESTSNVISLINRGFDYVENMIHGDGRNYGMSLMLQKNSGYVTGYVSYNLGWARRKFPTLDGRNDYIYAASHERRHDLNIVLNSRFAKRWSVGAVFVLASGKPYTRILEAYMLNGNLICHYSTYNGAHLPTYHRLDLSCSYDIIQKNGHTLGVNLSLYNAYCQRNAQFIMYRNDLKPTYGSSLSTIIPSISIYGTF